jgi:hypothetical protein
MKTTATRRIELLSSAMVLLGTLLGAPSVFAQNGSSGTVIDAAPNMVRSDGGGTYIDDACDDVAIASSGFWQLRTVRNAGVCNGEPSYWTPGATVFHRWLTLDFGSPVSPTISTTPGDLDGNGVAQPQEFAPARFVFNEAYARKARTGSTTPVHIYVLRVLASGATTQDTAWDVEYRSPANITINPDGSRTLSLGAGAAIADLYMIASLPHGKTQSNYMGTYNLPFSVVAK